LKQIDGIKFHPEALQEAVREADRLSEWSYQRGREFDAALGAVLRLIESHPHAGPADLGIRRDGRVRRVLMAGFQHLVFYVVVDRTLWVVAVASTKRQPGYWVDRLGDVQVPAPKP
jgi:toxin ParE1/3/4